MAKKLGNDYRLWIESTTPGTYNIIKGQQSLEYDRQANPIDTSTKDDFPYATSAPGLFNTSISLDGIADLPDATGFTRAESQFKLGAATKFQIRKNGAAGVTGDAVFEATCNILSMPISYGQNAPTTYKLTLGLASAPVTDALS
jgi:predicted secreted protein